MRGNRAKTARPPRRLREPRRFALPDAGLVLAVVVLAALFVPESDDCYFVYWQYDSWTDLLLTRPVTDGAQIVGVPQNGRYLGNLLGVLLAKSWGTPWAALRVAYFAGGLLLLAWAGAAWLCPRRRREGTFLLLALLVLSFRGLWQEVYSWGAAYVNYLTPMALALLLPLLLRGDGCWRPGSRRVLLALVSCAACLFLETVTIFLVLCALAVLGAALWTRRGRGEAAALLLGTALGAAVMFSAPGYGAVNSDGLRELGLSLVGESLAQTLAGTVARPALTALFLTALLLWLLRRRGERRWLPWALVALPLHLLCLAAWVRDLADPGETVELPPADPVLVGAGGALAALWVVLLLLWRGRDWQRTAALAAALCLLSAPLLVIGVKGNRFFFPGYVALALIALSLWETARREGLSPAPGAGVRALALLAACALVFVYWSNRQVYCQRMEDALAQAAGGAEQVTLPLVPFPGYARNEQIWKGDVSYQIYRETPWDVAFTFVPYDQWADFDGT